VAAIDVPEGEAAKVVAGQRVRLMLDAYPYTRHGVVPATLTWVSPAAQAGNVPAVARLERTTIDVDGVERTLSVGASGGARIDTGRETTLHFLLEPLSRMRERVSN